MECRSRRVFLVLALVLTASSGPLTRYNRAQAQPPPTFSYRVKYLCSNLHPFPTVFHWTDINILNPSPTQTATVRKKFVVSGTQKAQTSVQPVRDRFRLGPNQAASIDCDEIQTQFKVPLSTPMEGFVEIDSSTRLTVVGIYDKCVTQPRVDIFVTSQVRTQLQLDGILPQPQQVRLQGPAVVRKEEMRIDHGSNRFLQRTELVSMNLEGTLRLPNGQNLPIRLIESPRFQSEGQITGEIDRANNAPVFPARSYFDVFFEIVSDDPGFQERIGRAYNVQATRVEAAISGIPPGRPLDTVPASTDADRLKRLFPEGRLETDASGEMRLVLSKAGQDDVEDPLNQYCAPGPTEIFSARSGAKIGQVSDHCHDPNPPAPDPPKHVQVPCSDASIDVEYIEPVGR